MSVENKIKQLLSRANGTEQLTEAHDSETMVADGKPSVNTAKDNSKAGQRSGQGDSSMPRQGSSKDADMEEVMDATGKNSAAAKASKEVNPLPMKGDAKSVKVQSMESLNWDSDWVILEQDEDNATAKVAGHKVTLHRSLSEPGTSDTYTLHHPSGAKKVKISFSKHGDGDEVHGEKVNQAFGLDSKHKLGHKIAGSMNGMGGVSKFEESVEWVINEEDEDNATAKVAGHKVTLHRSLSEPGSSDTYTLHHPSGAKKVKISFDTHGDGDEVHGEKVNKAFGLDSKHKLGHKIAGSMNGMGGVSKFEESVDIKGQLDSIFGEDLSEEFRTKASSIFEAAVIARVNNEMEKVTSKLEEQTANQLVEFKEALIEKVDGYLNYVVEQYMEENELAIESGLRTEIAEDFIQGMKTLFKEHFIEVPEEKYDVLDELQAKSESLQSELDESITQSIELAKELNSLKASAILDEHTQDLADTEAEKLRKLIEGVDFDSEDLYREKVSVIKENYFPKTPKQSPEKMLVEESGTNPSAFIDNNSMMSRYVDTLSRSIKNR
jgi:hypothetical protein